MTDRAPLGLQFVPPSVLALPTPAARVLQEGHVRAFLRHLHLFPVDEDQWMGGVAIQPAMTTGWVWRSEQMLDLGIPNIGDAVVSLLQPDVPEAFSIARIWSARPHAATFHALYDHTQKIEVGLTAKGGWMSIINPGDVAHLCATIASATEPRGPNPTPNLPRWDTAIPTLCSLIVPRPDSAHARMDAVETARDLFEHAMDSLEQRPISRTIRNLRPHLRAHEPHEILAALAQA